MIKCDKCGENMIVDTRVVLTSIPPMYECYCPKCNNRKYAYCSECSENEKIDFDCYVGIGFNATKERCNAIPVEFLKQYLDVNSQKFNALIAEGVRKVIKDWEKENESTRSDI